MNEASDLAPLELRNGVSISHYRIDSLIGAGGMGEVYRAHDSQLDRPVALKILPADLVRDADRARRFVQEAKTASSLNHPHIVTIYEIGRETVGTREIQYIAMELIDGRTLREAIHGEKLPLKKLTDLLAQAADALAKAHASGIVHRDLKPDNIMVTHDGFAKVLDFGIAKLTEAAFEGPSITQARTRPSKDRTRDGVILGTPSYMSPEQAQGKPVDHRTDIFSLGCILYEAATRKKAFESSSDITALAKIVHEDPPPAIEVNPKTPPQLSHVIRRCLAKDPDERYQSMKDLAIELREISKEFETLSPTPGARGLASIAPRRIRLAIPLIVIAVALTAAAILLLRKHPPQPVIQSALNLPAGSVLGWGSAALSPDGTRLVFAVRASDKYKHGLWIRRLDTGTMESLEGTNDGEEPFWSPDSQFIGFFAAADLQGGANGKLKRIAASGGTAETICDVPYLLGGTWSQAGVILFAPSLSDGIFSVSASGGNPVRVTHIDRNAGEVAHAYPSFLSDGRHFLYSSLVLGPRGRENFVYAGSLDGKERKLLLRSSSNAVYAEPGYLLFMRGHTLFAQRFDATRLRLVGEARIAIDHVERVSNVYLPVAGSFAVSENGLLVYQAARGTQSKLVLLDRGGKEIEQVAPPGNYLDPALSHDGRQAAVSIVDEDENSSVWRIDLTRHTMTRLTSELMSELNPQFSPDDRRIVFSPSRSTSMYVKDVTGSGAEILLPAAADEVARLPNDWSPDGRFILYSLWTRAQQWNLSVFSLPDRKSIPFAIKAMQGRFSPDGRWIAYLSWEMSDKKEVYVQSFPPGAGKWQVSTNGGDMPRWRSDGKEIFYYAQPDYKLMADVRPKPDGTFDAGVPKPLFNVRVRWSLGGGYSVSRDGQHFLVNMAIDNPEPPITLVQNWLALLKR